MADFRVDTPESVDLALEPAGLGSRFLAALIDTAIQGGAAFVLFLILIWASVVTNVSDAFNSRVMGNVFVAILSLVLAFLSLGYFVLMEALWNGQTLGKRVAGVRVLKANGLPVGFSQVLIRNLMRIVDALPIFYVVGSIAVLFTGRHQRLGDMVAGTVVVRDRRAAAPNLPRRLTYQPPYDLNLLREHVHRLPEQDLEAARGFWERRSAFDPMARYRVAARIAEGLAIRMNWTEPYPHPEMFIESVLYLRSQ